MEDKKSEKVERQLFFEGKPISFDDYPLVVGGRGEAIELFPGLETLEHLHKQVILALALPKEYVHGEPSSYSSYSGAHVVQRESDTFDLLVSLRKRYLHCTAEEFDDFIDGQFALRRALGYSATITDVSRSVLQIRDGQVHETIY